MTPRSLRLTVALLALGFSPTVVAAQASSACRPADAASARMLRWLTHIVTGTDPASVAQRTQMALPQVSASQISLVTDKTVCSKVLNVYKANVVNADASGAAVQSSGKLYVFKIGTIYTATDPGQLLGEFGIWVTVDGRYTLLGSSMG
jgi:hypothetical protein